MTDPELLRLRDSIDNIDAALIHILAERLKCTQAVGRYKAEHPNWSQSNECFTDEGYGRYRPCNSWLKTPAASRN